MIHDTSDLNNALAHSDPAWAFYRLLAKADRDLMDRELVKSGHTLAYQPGTQWDRFQRLHAAGYRFGAKP